MTNLPEAVSDPRHTFDAFVVGPANRLAAAAARRAAESPGTSFNPLFLYASSGLGKSHILSAVANHSDRVHPENAVAYRTLEGYLEELMRALEEGGQGGLRDRYAGLALLLLDDVQFLTGQPQAQEMLLRTLDSLTERGAQVILASDRPPSEINGLDERLLSRFSGGLIVDMGSPDYETRVAILRRKAEDRGAVLAGGTAEAMARFPFRNVRELQGALNRVLAMQDMEGRPVAAEEIPAILGTQSEGEGGSSGGRGSPQVTAPVAAPAAVPDEPRWRHEVRAAVRTAEARGYETQRIARLLDQEHEPSGWSQALEHFRAGVRRSGEIEVELEDLGNPWPEAAQTLLRDPDRLEEAEQLLASARERARPFPPIGPGPRLESLGGGFPPVAVGAAERLLRDERPDYSPLYLYSADPSRARSFLEAVGRSYLAADPAGRVGLISVEEFSQEFIRAISSGVAGAWRERWWSVEVLLLYGVEDFTSTERAQEEFFHLFEALKRRTARIFLASDRAPGQIAGVDERLRSRFEGGLVVELGSGTAGAPAAATAAAPRAVSTAVPQPKVQAQARSEQARPEPAFQDWSSPERAPRETAKRGASAGPWHPRPERIVWDWPIPEERIAGEEG